MTAARRGRAALVLVALLAGCREGGSSGAPGATTSAAPGEPAAAIVVPRADAALALDGELDETAWSRAARTGAFVDDAGAPARPFSEARFLEQGGTLFVALYAADDDIRAAKRAHDDPVYLDDAFSVRLSTEAPGSPTYLLDVSARGVITDARRDASGHVDASWESGARAGADRDGTLDDATDEDEEWVVELAIPLASIGAAPGSPVVVDVQRCDTPRDRSGRRCGAFRSHTLAIPR